MKKFLVLDFDRNEVVFGKWIYEKFTQISPVSGQNEGKKSYPLKKTHVLQKCAISLVVICSQIWHNPKNRSRFPLERERYPC